MTSAMTRAELTEKLLGIKRENGWSWNHICAEVGACHRCSLPEPFSAK